MRGKRNKLDNLVDGLIPIGKPCPYYDYCANFRRDYCKEIKPVAFSCGMCRAFTYLKDDELPQFKKLNDKIN